MIEPQNTLRDALILAGIEEINQHGISDFSMRHVAQICNVSCAAPYRHFKDKKHFIEAIIQYVNGIWAQRQQLILNECSADRREQLTELSVQYICFLMEKPFYRSVLMLNGDGFNNLYHKNQSSSKSLAQQIQDELQKETGLDDEAWQKKQIMIRSLIFGMVFLFDAGEFEYNEKTMGHIRALIAREFDTI